MKLKARAKSGKTPRLLITACSSLMVLSVIFFSPLLQTAKPEIQWKTFSSPEEHFSISMPDLPRKKTSSKISASGRQVTRYDSIFENAPWYSILFNLAVIRLAESELQGKTPEQLFHKIAGAALAKKQWVVVHQQKIQLGPYTGLDIELRIPASKKYGRSRIRARLFTAHGQVYLLQTTYVPKTMLYSRLETDSVIQFFKSFTL